MKSIAFFNNKGGVAKTTSVVNIDYILGKVYQRKVLIVDCDGQQNASRFLSDEIGSMGIEKVLTEKTVSPDSSLTSTRYENIDVLTSTSEINNCCEKFHGLDISKQECNLKKLIDFWK